MKLLDVKNDFIPSIFYGLISETILNKFSNNSYFIPASSYAISQDLNLNLSNEINGNSHSNKVNKELMSLLLDKKISHERIFKTIACEMNMELFGGIVDFRDMNEGFKFIDEKNNIEFDFQSVSASVKELTPFIKYLTDLSKIDDTIIIEEPKNHLHPKNQRILVKYIVKLINNGLNIF